MHQTLTAIKSNYPSNSNSLLQDGNILCNIDPSCGVDDLLHENAYWQRQQQQQQYFETISVNEDATETPSESETEATKDSNTLYSTQVPQSNVFIEKITIPESEHDTVTSIYSEKVRASANKDRPYRLKSRHKARDAKHFRDIKLQERDKKLVWKTDPIKTKTFAFSNELIQRYISVNDGQAIKTKPSDDDVSRAGKHRHSGWQDTREQGRG